MKKVQKAEGSVAEAVKHIHREIVEHIDPDARIRVEKIVPGPREFEADVLVAPAANPVRG